MLHPAYRCPACRASLEVNSEALRCTRCGAAYPVENQIADFAGGKYYDNFSDASELAPEHIRGLELEKDGATTRIAAYYLPLCGGGRALDAGCGNGISIDLPPTCGDQGMGVEVS